jgi:hypothetical protein
LPRLRPTLVFTCTATAIRCSGIGLGIVEQVWIKSEPKHGSVG